MPPSRLSIIGVGLLGGSIGLAVKNGLTSCRIKGYGHRKSTLDQALNLGAIDSAAVSAADAVAGADLVILCTPVGLFDEILRSIGPALAPGAIVTDVGSTKRSVVRLAQEILPSGVHFVGSHPMAGSEKRGVEFAKADLFKNALCITTPTARTDLAAVRTVESFWQTIGMRVTRLTPDDHDRLLADVSHLPHALAAALTMLQSDQALPLAGKGFLDSTRIAAGDPGLWRDIFIDNSDNLRDGLRRLRGQIERFEAMLLPEQSTQLHQWLDAAAKKRRGRSDGPLSGE